MNDVMTNVMLRWQGLLATFTFWDAIDIFVVAFFLYRLHTMLKNTSAKTLAKGLLILMMTWAICSKLNLHVITWILEKGIQVIMLALPVVFQPELRRALDQIGRGTLFRKHNSEMDSNEIENILNNIADAVRVMSKEKVGALIVFERTTGLEDRIETGIKIDGLISSALLQNIFVKNTPLHDRAVIIRGNRIVAASCDLIGTERKNIDQNLGSRHRAALGVSEKSDAIALIVSEETGTISIARDGDLLRHLTTNDVKDILRAEVFVREESKQETIMDKLGHAYKALIGGDGK